jgi:recombination protein RecA
LRENQSIALEIEDKIRAAHGLDFDMEKESGASDDDLVEV